MCCSTYYHLRVAVRMCMFFFTTFCNSVQSVVQVALVAKCSDIIMSLIHLDSVSLLLYFGKRWYPQISSPLWDLVIKIGPKMPTHLNCWLNSPEYSFSLTREWNITRLGLGSSYILIAPTVPHQLSLPSHLLDNHRAFKPLLLSSLIVL